MDLIGKIFGWSLIILGALLVVSQVQCKADVIRPENIYQQAPGWPIYTNYALDGHECDGYENVPGTNCVQWIAKEAPFQVFPPIPLDPPPVIPELPRVMPTPEPGYFWQFWIVMGALFLIILVKKKP